MVGIVLGEHEYDNADGNKGVLMAGCTDDVQMMVLAMDCENVFTPVSHF